MRNNQLDDSCLTKFVVDCKSLSNFVNAMFDKTKVHCWTVNVPTTQSLKNTFNLFSRYHHSNIKSYRSLSKMIEERYFNRQDAESEIIIGCCEAEPIQLLLASTAVLHWENIIYPMM